MVWMYMVVVEVQTFMPRRHGGEQESLDLVQRHGDA